MVYDSAKWDNITLAFFLVDHFPRVIAFVLFHFVLCYFSVFHLLILIKDFISATCLSIYIYFLTYRFWSFPP